MTEPVIPRELLQALFDGELSDADVVALENTLAGSDAARRAYVDAIHLREGLRRWCRSRGAADLSTVIDLGRSREATVAPLGVSQHASVGRDRTRESWEVGADRDDRHSPAARQGGFAGERGAQKRRAATVVLGFAAAVVLAATGFFLRGQWQAAGTVAESEFQSGDRTISEEDFALSESETVVARLVAATPDVRWARGRVPSDFLMRFRPGDILGIESGTAKVEFSGGVHLVLGSPGAIQFTGASSARLMQGSVTGRAENASFALVTPSATVVDIGTEFGIGVDKTGTDVTVFEGELHVHSLPGGGGGGAMRRVHQGMSMRIDADGTPTATTGDGRFVYRRDLLHPSRLGGEQATVSLLDLVGGHDYSQSRIAGSIDPRTGYWGKPSWVGPDRARALRGDTQFNATDWNRMVDGVFIPRANAREMQIDSDGHMVYLPPNRGSTWGPIWARRRSQIDRGEGFTDASRQDHWGGGTLEAVHRRLLGARDGLLGLHANVGITFDLQAVRETHRADVGEFTTTLVNMGVSADSGETAEHSLADLRVFVDGKLRYSRLEFGAADGEVEVSVALTPGDRFLTVVATDSDGDPRLDHVVLVDPVLHTQPAAPTAHRAAFERLYAVNQAAGSPPSKM